MRLLIHRLTSATATSRLCEHTWRLQEERHAHPRSALESGRRSRENKQVPVQHLSRSCWKHQGYGFVKLQPDVRVHDTASVWRLDLIEDQLIMNVTVPEGGFFGKWLINVKNLIVSVFDFGMQRRMIIKCYKFLFTSSFQVRWARWRKL